MLATPCLASASLAPWQPVLHTHPPSLSCGEVVRIDDDDERHGWSRTVPIQAGARPLEIHQRETSRQITPTRVPSSVARHFSCLPGRIFSRVGAPPSTRSRYFYDASSRVPRSASSDSSVCTSVYYAVQLVSRSHFPFEFQPEKGRRRRVYRG